MHILHVVTRLGLGGAERVMETLALESMVRGHTVSVLPVSAAVDAEMARRLEDRLRAGGVDVIGGARAQAAKPAVIAAARRLAHAVAGLRPDVVHVHTEIPEFTWALASLGSRSVRTTPVVRTIHNSLLWGGWGRLGRLAEARLAHAQVGAVSVAASKAFVRWRADAGVDVAAPVVIYNGIDLSALPAGPGAAGDPPVLAFVGRFEPQKGIDTLLESLDQLSVDAPPFRVAIHGSGGSAPLVDEAAARWPDRISVGPPIPNASQHLDRFDAILMPSRFEGLPLLAIEAMVIGIPILATAAPGLEEVFPPHYPGRCPPGDPAAYAALMRDYLEHPAAWRTHAASAREHAVERFSMVSMVDAYEGLYRAVSG